MFELQNSRKSAAPLDSIKNILLGSYFKVAAENECTTDTQDDQYNDEPEWQCVCNEKYSLELFVLLKKCLITKYTYV